MLRMEERPPEGFFPYLFPQIFGECQRKPHKEAERPALPSGMAASNKCLSFAAIQTLDFTNQVWNYRKPASQNNALHKGPLRHAHWSLFCPRRGLQPWRETRLRKPFLVTASRVCRWALRCGKTQECLNRPTDVDLSFLASRRTPLSLY